MEPIRAVEIKTLTEPRRRIVEAVSRLSRAANFREQVLTAYGHRCAVTRWQLRLVDAAHILPVPAPGSSDDVRNGIALIPTYHRAFDNGLIYLDEDYVMKVSAKREAELADLDLAGGLEDFKARLGRVHLPPNFGWRPDKQFIRKANQYRRIVAE